MGGKKVTNGEQSMKLVRRVIKEQTGDALRFRGRYRRRLTPGLYRTRKQIDQIGLVAVYFSPKARLGFDQARAKLLLQLRVTGVKINCSEWGQPKARWTESVADEWEAAAEPEIGYKQL